MKAPFEGHSQWLQYITVDDCEAALERAKRNGGEVVSEVMEVEGIGRFAHIRDPLGAYVAVIAPAA